MLRIYQVILDTIEALQPWVRRVELRDKDLGRQFRRASNSIALNVAEGMYSRVRNRQVRYDTALGSARETLSCLELAQRCHYVVSPGEALYNQLRQIIGTLVKLAAWNQRAGAAPHGSGARGLTASHSHYQDQDQDQGHDQDQDQDLD
ncbi:MAG TPA: four helix bundle protein [Polyangiaceae bacterium]|nr:four helix bundle protein [Polyangiaceae bacterium]